METESKMDRIPGTKLYTVTVGDTKIDGLPFLEAGYALDRLMYGVERKEETEKEGT